MKDGLRYTGSCLFRFLLTIVLALVTFPVLARNVNIQCAGNDPSPEPVQIKDSVSCEKQLTDSLTKFAHYVSTDREGDHYQVDLSMLGWDRGRIWFYNSAELRGIVIEDKSKLFTDPVPFLVHDTDRTEVGQKFRELYLLGKEEELQMKGRQPLVQDTLYCQDARVACSDSVYTFPSMISGVPPHPVNYYPNYGCLSSYPCPSWFYMQVGVSGDIIIHIEQTKRLIHKDVDFICWGPFSSLTDGCATGLTGTCRRPAQLPNYPYCCDNDEVSCSGFYPRGNIVDCSYSASWTETCHILNAQVGEIYILLLTNYSQDTATITFYQESGDGRTNCDIVVHCSMITITTNTSACDPYTGTYSVSGNAEFSNPPPGGTLTVTDLTAIPPVSQILYPPFVSPLAYNLTGIPCDGLVHSIKAAFSDSLACQLTSQYTAPMPSCPSAIMSGGGNICNNGSSTATISITLTGVGPYSFTWAIDGIPQPPVVGYNGPSPYTFQTMIPGVYTMVSLSNPACINTGIVSGNATVSLLPLPVPAITGDLTACAGSGGHVYSTMGGNHDYQWTISAGGLKTAGGGTSDSAVTVTWNTAGAQNVSVNYIDTQGCAALTPTVFAVTVKAPPVVTNAGPSTTCSGAPIHIVPQANLAGTTFAWTATGSSPAVSGYKPGSGSSIDDTLFNSGLSIETVTYSVTATKDGCSGIPAQFTVTVIPMADVYFVPASQVICPGARTSIQNNSHVPGAVYSWTASGSSPDLGGFSSGVGSTINQQLSNSGYIQGVVTYHVTPSVSGCSGTPGDVPVTVNPAPVVTFTLCNDAVTYTYGKPFRLKGGIPLGGTYSGAGVNSSTGYFYPNTAGPGSHTITYTYANTFTCQSFATLSLTVRTSVTFNCGQNLTDIRDGKVYPTLQIGSQCWMAADLNFGTTISPDKHQRDNCIPEGYYNPASSIQYPASAYQWDELMSYDDTQASQGLCPPGWHVPTEADWTTLFANYLNNGYAGNALKASGFSGFNAELWGARLMNRNWYFPGFATYYWSSTAVGTEKAWAHAMNDPDPSVSYYPSLRTNAFAVRCLKD
jgi:uncharacterized protein (TIGR02145 family)